MIQTKINNTYQYLQEIKQIRINGNSARQIYFLKKALEPHFQFYLEETRKLIEECGGTIGEGGRINFADVEKAREYMKLQTELDNAEVDVNVEVVTISLSQNPNLTLSAEDIENVEGFIEFID